MRSPLIAVAWQGPKVLRRAFSEERIRDQATADSIQRRSDLPARRREIGDRQEGEIDIHGQAREIPQEKIDRRAALQGEAIFFPDERQHPHQQLDLAEIWATWRDHPGRLGA